jgi:hypothetical protein
MIHVWVRKDEAKNTINADPFGIGKRIRWSIAHPKITSRPQSRCFVDGGLYKLRFFLDISIANIDHRGVPAGVADDRTVTWRNVQQMN